MTIEYVAEKRIAVVMYGGVSLAIYMGGVAQELLNVVRATSPARRDPKKPDAPLRPGLDDVDLSPIEAVYREAATADGGKLTNVTIDVIAGTSAGGINGIFLAKALANDLPMTPILKLWIEEGDIARLLNDRGSLQGTSLARQDPPPALLNGQRMYLKLVEAFDEMDDVRAGKAPQFDAGRVDLFVTATDIPGEVVRLPVDNNSAAQERMHKQRFHFAAGTQDHELAREQNPLLAFAARCTSSFPVAFEPFTWKDAAELAGKRAEDLPWKDRLLFVGDKYEERPFTDGGVLDNKPFSYAIDELSKRQSHLRVERMLVYVEPDPEKFDRARATAEKPSAFETALFALTIPAEQTIRNDLQNVIERNQRIEKLNAVETEVRDRLHEQTPPRLSRDQWLSADMPLLIRLYGLQYPAYHRVKVDSVVSGLSEMICSNASIGRPELVQVIRELLVAWVHGKYRTTADELRLLLDADLDYRLRKLSFLLRLLNKERELADRSRVVVLRRELQAHYDHVALLRSRIENDIGLAVGDLRVPGALLSDANLLPIARSEMPAAREAAIKALLDKTVLGDRLATYLAEENRRKELASISDATAAAVKAAGLLDITQAHQAFESYDMVIYPITRRGDVDEAVPVKILRISPLESSLHRDAPLAGKQLGHFGAFLDEGFRHNDITWGRLDAASVILKQMVSDKVKADKLIERAHWAIMAEQVNPDLTERVMGGSLPKGVKETALGAIRDPERLLAAFRAGEVYDLQVHGVQQLGSASRAGEILEKITRSWALERKLPLPRFIGWGVLGIATLAQVAIPRSFFNALGKYWGALLFLLFTVLGVAGYFLNQWSIVRAGAEGAGVVVLLSLTVFAIRAVAGERTARFLYRILHAVLAVALVWFAALAVRMPPAQVREWLQMDQWWGRLDTLAVQGALIGMALGFGLPMLRNLFDWAVAFWRRPRLF
jgi:patatin-related protein